MNLSEFLNKRAHELHERAAIYRRVANDIKVHHKKFTRATVTENGDAYIGNYYRKTLSIRYQMTRRDSYVGNEKEDFWLTEGADDTPLTPLQVRDAINAREKQIDEHANRLEIEAQHIEQKVAQARALLTEANAVIDELSPEAREFTGLKHIYDGMR